jgi:hypothetical protein
MRIDQGVELQNEITFHPSFKATTVFHPATYLNKVLVGGHNGELQLWNIRTWLVSPSYSMTWADTMFQLLDPLVPPCDPRRRFAHHSSSSIPRYRCRRYCPSRRDSPSV